MFAIWTSAVPLTWFHSTSLSLNWKDMHLKAGLLDELSIDWMGCEPESCQ